MKRLVPVGGWFVCLSACLAIAGCNKGHPGPTIEGRLTRNGQPLTAPEKGMIVMEFYQIDDKGNLGENASPAIVDKTTGTFTAEVLEGKYRVTVHRYEEYPMGPDTLEDKFSQRNSPITYDVTGGADDVEIKVDDYDPPAGQPK